MLRKQQVEGGLPNFIVYIPNECFKMYKLVKTTQGGAAPIFQLEIVKIIKFKVI